MERPDLFIELDNLFAEYIWQTSEKRKTIVLWLLHSYVHDQFSTTPRLALLSPMFQCGKTNVLRLIERLGLDPAYSEDYTPASIYTLLDTGEASSFLFDEVNLINTSASHNSLLRRIWNGNIPESGLIRRIGKKAKKYSTYAPMAFAAKANKGNLPNDLIQRSIVIEMHRAPPEVSSTIKRIKRRDPELDSRCKKLRKAIRWWAEDVVLSESPAATNLANRWQDNWIPLLAIADDMGHGEEARRIAKLMCSGLPDDDAIAYLLWDIRNVFNELEVDRIWNEELVLHLLRGERHGEWDYWAGVDGKKPPHPITGDQVARLLYSHFKLKARSIREKGGGRGSSVRRGYTREDFEPLWASYLPGLKDK
jgi:hypothetical protein